MTNPITADVWAGIRARHSLVESAGQPTEAARAMAYLSHLDRRDLIAEIERLQKELRRLAQEVVDEDKRTVGPEGPSAGLLDLAENALKGLSAEPGAEPIPVEDLCAICEGAFIDHRYGALGHDWRPKPIPHAQKSNPPLQKMEHGPYDEVYFEGLKWLDENG